MTAYHLRGAVPADSAAFVQRQFAEELLTTIHMDRWVLLLGPRQHGKTTALIRIQSRLQDLGYLCTKVDFQSSPPGLAYRELLEWLATELAQSFGMVTFDRPSGLYERDVRSWLRAVVPEGQGKVVVIIDEAAAIANRDALESFYGQLRALYNRRANCAPGTLESRLVFVFAGTFLPEKLIQNSENSPFNVCEPVDTDDLSLTQIEELQRSVEGAVLPDECRQIYEAVGGQPFLVQRWLAIYRDCRNKGITNAAAIAHDQVYMGMDGHFESLLREVKSDIKLRAIVRNMIDESEVAMRPTDSDYRFLVVQGLAHVVTGKLVFRNSIYREMAKLVCGASPERTA